jgi:DNA polymerase III delta prime subunit
MKKILLSIFSLALLIMPSTTEAATWNAENRVDSVGKVVIEKNSLPAKLQFKIVENGVNNSDTATTNIIQVSKDDLKYAGNDNEVAAVISYELGQIINGKSGKEHLRAAAKALLAEKLSQENIVNTAANSEFIKSKVSLGDQKEADMTAIDLMVKAGYNPLALVVVITKMPGTNLETIMGTPANSERAMSAFDYLSYNYPAKVKAGYGCQEYRNFLVFANPIIEKRNQSKRLVKKYAKLQEKIKKNRAKSLAQYQQTGGLSGWDATYTLLHELATSPAK